MNKVYNKFSIIFLFAVFVSYSPGALARYELPADYTTSEAAADEAVTEARAKTLEAVKALQTVIRQYGLIVKNGQEDDKVISDLLAEVRRLEAGGASGTTAASTDGIVISRKALARVASQKGNGFRNPTAVLELLNKTVAEKPDDNKWKPVKGAINKAIKSLGQ